MLTPPYPPYQGGDWRYAYQWGDEGILLIMVVRRELIRRSEEALSGGIGCAPLISGELM